MTDIDALTRRLDNIVKSIDAALDAEVRKRKQSFHLTHDDGVDDGKEINASDPTADDDGDNPGDSYDNELGDAMDDEEDDDGISKLGVSGAAPPRYHQEETARYAQENDSTHRPGSLETSDHPSSNHARHRFLALVAAIKNEHGIPATQAMAYARQKDPTGYLAFQGRSVTKSARSLLQQEMAKGVTEEIAKQRLVNLYGAAALDEQNRSMSKAEATAVTAENELLKRAGALWEDDPALSRTDALRKARQDHPSLYRRMTR
jgi:hypothetical protein